MRVEGKKGGKRVCENLEERKRKKAVWPSVLMKIHDLRKGRGGGEMMFVGLGVKPRATGEEKTGGVD